MSDVETDRSSMMQQPDARQITGRDPRRQLNGNTIVGRKRRGDTSHAVTALQKLQFVWIALNVGDENPEAKVNC